MSRVVQIHKCYVAWPFTLIFKRSRSKGAMRTFYWRQVILECSLLRPFFIYCVVAKVVFQEDASFALPFYWKIPYFMGSKIKIVFSSEQFRVFATIYPITYRIEVLCYLSIPEFEFLPWYKEVCVQINTQHNFVLINIWSNHNIDTNEGDSVSFDPTSIFSIFVTSKFLATIGIFKYIII